MKEKTHYWRNTFFIVVIFIIFFVIGFFSMFENNTEKVIIEDISSEGNKLIECYDDLKLYINRSNYYSAHNSILLCKKITDNILLQLGRSIDKKQSDEYSAAKLDYEAISFDLDITNLSLDYQQNNSLTSSERIVQINQTLSLVESYLNNLKELEDSYSKTIYFQNSYGTKDGRLILEENRNNYNYFKDDLQKELKLRQKDKFSDVLELHWIHMPLTYTVNFSEYKDQNIRIRKERNVQYALERLHNAVSSIDFIKINNENIADINFKGEIPIKVRIEVNAENFDEDNLAVIENAVGLAILNNITGNIILKYTIYTPYTTYITGDDECPSSDITLHEILHAFGLPHSTNTESVLWDTASCTNNKIIQKDIDYLKRIYG